MAWAQRLAVSARDEEELLDTLDQVADSECAAWSVYRPAVDRSLRASASSTVDSTACALPSLSALPWLASVGELAFHAPRARGTTGI